MALVPGVMERGVAWLKTYQERTNPPPQERPDQDDPLQGDRPTNLDAFVDMVLVDGGVKNAEMLDFLYRDRTELGRLRQVDVRPCAAGPRGQGQAGDGPGEHRPVRRPRRREPDVLPEDAEREFLVVLVRQRVRGARLLPQAPGPHRPQGPDRLAAGQVPDQQPEARDLLGLDPRHGHLHRGAGRIPQGQRRVEARYVPSRSSWTASPANG